MDKSSAIEIREITSFEEIGACVDVQLEVFNFADLDASPLRQFVTTMHSGGFTLGAFAGARLVGMILTSPALRGNEAIFYSNMAAVIPEFQGSGVGARLKWAQRKRALEVGIRFIKWTFQPVQARNAFFNLEKLGAVVRQYFPNYYGTGFSNSGSRFLIDSDRLFAEWDLESLKVRTLAQGESYTETRKLAGTIEIPPGWNALLSSEPELAAEKQIEIKKQFTAAFADGQVVREFRKDPLKPHYRLFAD